MEHYSKEMSEKVAAMLASADASEVRTMAYLMAQRKEKTTGNNLVKSEMQRRDLQ